MNEIIAINNNKHDLNRLDENPAAVYLKSLRHPPTFDAWCFGQNGGYLYGRAITNPLQFPWHLLKYQHVQT